MRSRAHFVSRRKLARDHSYVEAEPRAFALSGVVKDRQTIRR